MSALYQSICKLKVGMDVRACDCMYFTDFVPSIQINQRLGRPLGDKRTGYCVQSICKLKVGMDVRAFDCMYFTDIVPSIQIRQRMGPTAMSALSNL